MSMPSIPISIFIDHEIKVIEGKTIQNALCEMIYEGKYCWHKGSFDNLNEVINSKITHADSHCILTDNGKMIDFGYFHGDLRYYTDRTAIQKSKLKNPVSNGYMVTLLFDDNTCLTLTLYS